MKAQVPAANLPTRMAVPNRLTSIYSTHVLIPRLGPIATQRYVRLYARMLRDLAAAVELIVAAQAYAKTYRKPVAIPAAPPAANRKDYRFKPLLGGGNEYQTHYMAGLLPFAFARPYHQKSPAKAPPPSIGGRAMVASKALLVDGGSFVTTASGESSELRFDAAAAWPKEVAQTMRDEPKLESDDGRLLIDRVTPYQYLASNEMRQRIKQWGKMGDELLDAKQVKKQIDDAKAGEALAQILHGIAQPNAVLADLLAAGAINATGRWLGEKLADARDVPETVAKFLAEHFGAPDKKRRDGISPLLEQALALLVKLGANATSLLGRLKAASSLRERLFGYIVWRVDGLGALDPGQAPLPDDSVFVGSREWAFRRTERLSIQVGTPTLRGPVATEAVAPASELVLSESSIQEVVSFSEQGSSRGQLRASESGSYNSATFRQALAHMTEEGINSEGAFSQESTLFDSLRERRRETIERTLSLISSTNEQRSGTMTRQLTSQSRSYTTRGKDPVFATTEVAFQVAAPVDVEIRLEDVGLVWCPRLASPFIALHRLVTQYEDESRTEYLTQNQVSDPARPAEIFESATFTKEESVRGNATQQVISFEVEIPGQYGDWELDDEACRVDFRNGTSDDYNWDEMWNLDDLENWHVYYRSIQRGTTSITCTVVFETTDPEMLNRGFIVATIAMRSLTDEARAALAAYELDRQEAAAQRQAVQVRARQYARMRRDELIEQYEGSLQLQEEAFAGLIRWVFQGGNPGHVSYWREILRSCIDWSAAGMRFEPADMNAMAYPQLPPSHFMNALGIRFILPIHRSAESTFFDALQTGAGTYFSTAALAVRTYVDGYRTVVEEAKAAEPDKLVLDSFKSEMVLGRHLEAVLSEHPFAEPT